MGFLSIHFVRKGKYAHEIVFLPEVPGLCPDTILAVSFSFQEPTNELKDSELFLRTAFFVSLKTYGTIILANLTSLHLRIIPYGRTPFHMPIMTQLLTSFLWNPKFYYTSVRTSW